MVQLRHFLDLSDAGPDAIAAMLGVMLQGAVAAFDQFSVLLERGGQIQLVYKHSISTLQPERPLNLEQDGGEE